MRDCEFLTFSKDRGSQLYSFLSSVEEMVTSDNEFHMYVLYHYTTEDHGNVYSYILDKWSSNSWITFIKQQEFYGDVVDIVQNKMTCGKIFFTPDDSLFIRPVNLSDAMQTEENEIMSLRLGTHLKVCHPLGNKPQKLPTFIRETDDKIYWNWNEGECDWGYPLALDTSVFDRNEILSCIHQIRFNTPTTFEASLQHFNEYFNHKVGVCYKDSKFLSLPWNVVTTEVYNKNGGIEADLFLEEWKNGKRIDHESIYYMFPVSCHQEVELKFVERDE